MGADQEWPGLGSRLDIYVKPFHQQCLCRCDLGWKWQNTSWRCLDTEKTFLTWWRHQMETFSALLAICAGNSPVTGEFPTQRPVTRFFDVYFDLRPKERLSKQSWGWWFETLSSPLWRHRNDHWPFGRESSGHQPTQTAHNVELLYFLCCWPAWSVNSRVADGLKRYDAHMKSL